MTDLLLSELVVLLLLLPVLLRPFSKSLKRGNAIPILPFLSLFVCICIIIGQGIVLYLFVLILFVLIVCLSEIIRLTAFFQGVLNDFYSIASIILRIALLCLFCGIVYGALRFAPEAHIRTEYPLTIRPIELADTTGTGLLIERQGGADKRALVIIAEAFPYSGRTETLAALLADQGYTVAEITQLKQHGIIPRSELYRKLLNLVDKKEQRYLPKEDNPQTAAFFADFLNQTVARYGRNKRIFLYAEGIYTDLAARFCTENPGMFTGVFFCLSEEEPLPSAPEGWAQIVREDTPENPAEADILTEPAQSPSSGSAQPTSAGPTSQPLIDPTQPTSGSPAQPVPQISAVSNPAQPERPLPFRFYIRPYSELAGFGQLRAEDVLAAELLGSCRSIGRQDKAAAAAAFDRYAILF